MFENNEGTEESAMMKDIEFVTLENFQDFL